jgi:hypothetical protein
MLLRHFAAGADADLEKLGRARRIRRVGILTEKDRTYMSKLLGLKSEEVQKDEEEKCLDAS